MLRPVILEYPVNVLLLGAEDQIRQKDRDFQKALHHVPAPQGEAWEKVEDPAGKQRGQHQKEENGHSHAQQHGKAHDGFFQLFAAEVLFQPLFKFGRLALFLLRVKVCGVHQGLHAADHCRQKIYGAPDQGNAQNGVTVLDELQLLHLFHQLTVFVPDHDGLLFRPAHQNAFDQRLSADTGAEGTAGMFSHK